jgi:hypothetical protein
MFSNLLLFVSILIIIKTKANEEIKNNKYDIDNTFCEVKISGSSINYTTTKFNDNDNLINLTLVLAGNAYKYNVSCNVNDENFHIGDKHYIIDLLLYGPIRQLKALRYSFSTTNQNKSDETMATNGIFSNELSKQISFGWLGNTRMLCIVKKYNYVLNKFTRCEQNMYLNVKEKPQPQMTVSVPSLQKLLLKQQLQQNTRKSSTIIQTSKLTTTIPITTSNVEPETTFIIGMDQKLINIEASFRKNSKISSPPMIILITFITFFIIVLAITVYVRKFGNSSTTIFQKFRTSNSPFSKNKFTKIDRRAPLSDSSSNSNNQNTSISIENEKEIDNDDTLNNSISSRCSRFIDEKEKSRIKNDEDSANLV